jgi:hypothetical protein
MAQADAERYTLAANKRILVDLLRLRFPPLPPEIEQTVESTHDADQITKWLHRFATAQDLDSVGILPPQ